MKTNLLRAIALAIVMTAYYSCSLDSSDIAHQEFELSNIEAQQLTSNANAVCDSENPKTQLTNNGSVPYSLEIYDMSGNLLNSVYDLQPGNVSNSLDFQSGNTLFSVTNSTYADEKLVYVMETCMVLDLEIGTNNQLAPNAPVQF